MCRKNVFNYSDIFASLITDWEKNLQNYTLSTNSLVRTDDVSVLSDVMETCHKAAHGNTHTHKTLLKKEAHSTYFLHKTTKPNI